MSTKVDSSQGLILRIVHAVGAVLPQLLQPGIQAVEVDEAEISQSGQLQDQEGQGVFPDVGLFVVVVEGAILPIDQLNELGHQIRVQVVNCDLHHSRLELVHLAAECQSVPLIGVENDGQLRRVHLGNLLNEPLTRTPTSPSSLTETL